MIDVTVDLTGIATSIATAIVGGLGIYVTGLVQRKIKNQEMRDLLNATIKNSVGRIQQADAAEIESAGIMHPTVPPYLAVGVQYVADHAADAITYFFKHLPSGQVSPAALSGVIFPNGDALIPQDTEAGARVAEKIADKISAQVGLHAIATNIAVAGSAGPIVVKPLDPVPTWKPIPPL